MTNAFRIVLDSVSVRRAVVEGVPETVIAAIYLLHERSVDEIADKLRPDELGHVTTLVSRSPSCYPPGTLEALKVRSPAPSPEPVASISTDRPPARIEPDAEDMRRAQERRLAGLRVRAPQTGSERERVCRSRSKDPAVEATSRTSRVFGGSGGALANSDTATGERPIVPKPCDRIPVCAGGGSLCERNH